MPKFLYIAKKGPKEEIKGALEAENKNAALHRLASMGYFPVSIEQEDMDRVISFADTLRGFRKINIQDLSIFTRQMADLLEAGLPLVKSLLVLEKQTDNKYLKGIIADLRGFVQDGNTLSASLERHPKVFSKLYVSMVRSGEIGGNMEKVLLSVAEFQESQEELGSKIKSAMAYPVLMAFVGAATILILITFVIPHIVTMFKDLNQSLPVPTVILLEISNFIRKFWFILVGGIFLIFVAFKRLTAGSEGKMAVDKFKLGVPLLGQLTLKADIARFSRTLATLLANGVPILDALDAAVNIIENEVLKGDIKLVQKEVREGNALAMGLAKGKYFPVFVNNMISVGEETGTVEKALFKVASAYEREVDGVVKAVTSLLEPIMILTLGLIIGFIVIAMLLPIFEISFVAQ